MVHEEFNFKGKIIVFKTLALSKTVHLCLIWVVPEQIIEESTLCNSFATGGLTNVDKKTKIANP